MTSPTTTQEELQALLASNPTVQPITAPQYFASGLQVQGTSNEYLLMMTQIKPVIIGVGQQQTQAAIVDTVALLHVSPGTLKDMSLLLASTVAQHEKDWGKVETEYTRRLVAENK